MPTPQELEAKFWKALKKDMTVMLGIDGVEDGHTRPMTANLDADEAGPLWFFTSTESALVQHLKGADRAIATFASKGHDLFATIHGSLMLDKNRATLDRLWNPWPGMRGARTIRNSPCSGSTANAPRSGKTRPVLLPASKCCSASIQKQTTKIRLPTSG